MAQKFTQMFLPREKERSVQLQQVIGVRAKGASPGPGGRRPVLWSKPCHSCAQHICLLGTGLKETDKISGYLLVLWLVHVWPWGWLILLKEENDSVKRHEEIMIECGVSFPFRQDCLMGLRHPVVGLRSCGRDSCHRQVSEEQNSQINYTVSVLGRWVPVGVSRDSG